jgi:demethylmenaquinone methyltransferase/2-methoxy-6-polyprenyl-1,4-benzoquinol methylase
MVMNLAKKVGQGFVNSVFTGVHNNYDKANDAMSLFLHRKWKKDFVEMLGVANETNVLDVASGTGDIAKLMLQKTKFVTLADINPQMLEIAKKKVGDVETAVCDASKMPFEDDTFDLITCVFGIRNFQEIEQAIVEMKRVLKPNGRLAIMEFMPNAQGKIQNKLYHIYLKKILPHYDKIFKNEENSYQYLADSILAFASKEDFARTLKNHGFGVITPSLAEGAVGCFLCSKNG